MTLLQKVWRVMMQKKNKEVKEKTQVVKITKGHAFLGIDFELPKKVNNLKYRYRKKKTQHLGTFRVGHRKGE